MGILGRKPKMSIEDFCRQFYDSQIFYVKTGDEGGASTLWESTLNLFAEADPSLAKVDRDLFRREMTALYMELFGLVWTHMFWGKMEKFLWPQITFTKSYLEQNGHQNIWDIMSVYNQEIGKQRNSYKNHTARSQRSLIAGVASFNSMMQDLWDDWSKKEKDKWCAARILNRIWSEGAWKRDIILRGVTATFAERLGWDTNMKVLGELMVVLSGFYVSAKQAIKLVKLQ